MTTKNFMATIFVTGGAGFIGSCYVLARCAVGDTIINLDKLTYSGNPENVALLSGNPRHIFVHGDIGNAEIMEHPLKAYRHDTVVNFAAESHMDHSILDSEAFLCVPTSSEPARFCALPKPGGMNWTPAKKPQHPKSSYAVAGL
jgi:nucleoside-diphosphate-sugar epimerase